MIASGQADIAICCGTEAPVFHQPMIELTLAKLSPATPETRARWGGRSTFGGTRA
jgi:3-oxoacyl-(acyl-carrier-protein) synthase